MAGQTSQPASSAPIEPVTRKGKSLHERYEQLWNVRGGVWIIGIVVLGLAAGIISKKPQGHLLAAAAYNLAIAAVHFFTACIGSLKPISPVNARPSNLFLMSLCFSSVVWPTAFGVMFATKSVDDAYEIVDLNKRAGIIISSGTTVVGLLENIAIACGCMGCSAFFCCLMQWYYVGRIIGGKFSNDEIQQAYDDE